MQTLRSLTCLSARDCALWAGKMQPAGKFPFRPSEPRKNGCKNDCILNTGQDFEHPNVPPGSSLRRHVLFKALNLPNSGSENL